MAAYPPPLTGQDPDQFTKDSIHVRLPNILEETARSNADWTPDRKLLMSELAQELRDDKPIRNLRSCPDTMWDGHPHVGQKYSEVPWFFLENYVYKRVLEIATDCDPFQHQKNEALHSAKAAFVSTVLPVASLPASDQGQCEAAVQSALLRSLWGNRADLSLTAGKVKDHGQGSTAHILSDDSAPVLDLLRTSGTAAIGGAAAHSGQTDGKGKGVAVILDNCGLELLCDLVLADTLLRTGYAGHVTFYCKAYPVFVSDAQPKDVQAHIDWLQGLAGEVPEAQGLVQRLQAAVATDAFRFISHPFFTTWHAYWDMASVCPDLATQLAQGYHLAIVKGDANYRRLVGDRHWPHDTPFAQVLSYFPCPILALRTCKAGVTVGVSKEAEARAVAADAGTWLISGQYGLIQLKA